MFVFVSSVREWHRDDQGSSLPPLCHLVVGELAPLCSVNLVKERRISLAVKSTGTKSTTGIQGPDWALSYENYLFVCLFVCLFHVLCALFVCLSVVCFVRVACMMFRESSVTLWRWAQWQLTVVQWQNIWNQCKSQLRRGEVSPKDA